MQEVCGGYEKLPFIKFHKWFFSISYRYDGCRGCWCLTEQVHVGTRWQDTGLPADLYNVRIWCCCKRGFCGQRCFTSLTDRTFMPCAASSFSLVLFITWFFSSSSVLWYFSFLWQFSQSLHNSLCSRHSQCILSIWKHGWVFGWIMSLPLCVFSVSAFVDLGYLTFCSY